jgi:hypothetical protein
MKVREDRPDTRTDAAKTAFWTLCILAYVLAAFGTACLVFDIQFIPYQYSRFKYSPEETFLTFMSYVASIGLIPLTIYLRRQRVYLFFGASVWLFQIFLFCAFPVY